MALFVSFIINVFVVSVFADSFYGKTLTELNHTAQSFYDKNFHGNAPYPIFPLDNATNPNTTDVPVRDQFVQKLLIKLKVLGISNSMIKSDDPDSQSISSKEAFSLVLSLELVRITFGPLVFSPRVKVPP